MTNKNIGIVGSDENMVFECLAATEKDLYCVDNFEVSTKSCEKTYGDIMYMLDGRGDYKN